MRKFGEYPVASWQLVRQAPITLGNYSFKFFWFVEPTLPNIEFNVWWNRSIAPFALALYTVIRILSIARKGIIPLRFDNQALSRYQTITGGECQPVKRLHRLELERR